MKSVPLTAAVTPRPIESSNLLRGRRRERPAALSLATLSRGLGVVALSGGAVVALVIARGPERSAGEPVATPRAAVAASAVPVTPVPGPAQDVRLVYGNPDAPRGYDRQVTAAPSVPAVPAPPIEPRPVAAQPAASDPVAPEPIMAESAKRPGALAAAGSGSLSDLASAITPAPLEPAVPAGEGVDLNTASLDQLNGLSAGRIGRAIVGGRPYAAPQDLVDRRILSRASFERIKGRVFVGAAR